MDTNGAGDAFVGGEITELICRQNGVFLWDGRYLLICFPKLKLEYCYKYSSKCQLAKFSREAPCLRLNEQISDHPRILSPIVLVQARRLCFSIAISFVFSL